MAQRTTLTEAQTALLRWVSEGCPAGVYEGVHHRISAAALARRDLISVSGRGASWSAKCTTAGREYLAEVDGPAPPVPRQANKSVTEQMVAEVVAAGGTLPVPGGRHGMGVDWSQRVRQAIRYNKVPPGKRLEYVSDWRSDTSELRLVDAPEGTDLVLLPVPVAERVSRYHRIVRQVREDKDRLEVANPALPRASRILQALVVEAERRGFDVSIPDGHRRRNDNQLEWTAGTDGHLVVTSPTGHGQAVRLHEEGLQISTVYKRPEWDPSDPLDRRRSGTYRQVRDGTDATGKLVLSLVPAPYRSSRIDTWSDRKGWTLEDKLPDVLAEIAVRAAEAEHDQREAERRAALRHTEWEAAMAQAKERHHDARQAAALADEVARWREANGIRAYCTAMSDAYPDDAATAEWISWALARAASLDPLASPPRSPSRQVEVSAEDLRPHLRGFSPYGPDASY